MESVVLRVIETIAMVLRAIGRGFERLFYNIGHEWGVMPFLVAAGAVALIGILMIRKQ